MNILYVVAGFFHTLCLELFVLFMMLSFQAFPGHFFVTHQRTIARILVISSCVAGVLGGVVCTIAEGYFSFEQYFMCLFPALFVPFLICGWATDLKRPNKTKDEEYVELYLEEGTYVIDSRVDTWNGQMRAVNVAYCEDKAIRFMAAVPRRPVTIKAYCKKTEKENQYLCEKYEEVKSATSEKGYEGEKRKCPKVKRTWKEIIEWIHSIILKVAALSIPLPTLPAFLWYKTNGMGENPFMLNMVFSLMVVVAGGCRRLFMHSHGFANKAQYVIFSLFYYLVLVLWIVNSAIMLF